RTQRTVRRDALGERHAAGVNPPRAPRHRAVWTCGRRAGDVRSATDPGAASDPGGSRAAQPRGRAAPRGPPGPALYSGRGSWYPLATNSTNPRFIMREAVVVATARTGLAKSHRGSFNNLESPTLVGHCIREVVKRAKLDPAEVEEVVCGAALQQ